MLKSTFDVPKMDYPSEERIVRVAPDKIERVQSLSFDLQERKVIARHDAPALQLLETLEPLGLGAILISTAPSPDHDLSRINRLS